ncbi:MAG TPA: HlyD family efflux transporter periplasmic adaptor subunit [Saprospiraceae bacterium]|nr:HlyD family efflux transporter periplasmic adaptor subunit [Saprospiraceae bacterium]
MNKRNARIISIVVGAALLAGAFAVVMFFKEAAEPPRRVPEAEPAPMATTTPVNNSSVATELAVQGELAAFNKIDIFAEVSGTLERTERPFKVGSYFPKGAPLIEVNQTEAKLNLLAQKSSLLNAITQLMPDLKIDYPQSFKQWKTYLDSFDVEQSLPPFPEPLNEQERYFIASRNLLNQYYTIQSAEERLSKYMVYAPFSGVITQTSIQPGALVRSGQKLGELMNTASYELEVTVPLSELKYISTGSKVKLNSRDIKGSWTGTVRRVNDQVDPGTQTVQVFIGVTGRDLKEGMYLTGSVNASAVEEAIRIPKELLVNQKEVYTVADQKLHLQLVDVVKITETEAIVKGLADGTQLLAEPIVGAFDGMEVRLSETKSQPKTAASVDQSGPAGGK